MPTVYTPDPTAVHSDITVPADGDAETAESVNSAFRDLADNAAEARSHVDGSAADTTIGASSLDTLTVNATTTFENDVNCSGFLGSASFECTGTSSFGDTAFFNGDVNLGDSGADTCTVAATSVFNAPVTINSNLTANSDADLGSSSSDQIRTRGTATCYATQTFRDAVLFTNEGRIVERYRIMPDSNVSDFGPSSKAAMFNGDGVLAASRKIIIDDTDAVDGDWFEVCNLDDTWVITVRDPTDSTTIGSALLHAASGSTVYQAKYRRMGGTWYQVSTSRGAP
jgi:hypothetical protein